jgi:hypothetical protein
MDMMFLKKACLLMGLLILLCHPSFGQNAQKGLASTATGDVVDSLGKVILENYIFPDTAANMVRLIKRQLVTGKYNSTEPVDLAHRLTLDLRSIYNDKHLSVEYTAEKNEVGNSSYILQAARQQQIAETARPQNYGFSSIAVLNGNIGYIALNGFFDLNDKSAQTVNSAFDILKNVTSLVIDLRLNGGGQADMVHYISSLFFEKRTHLNDFHVRNTNTLQSNWSTPRPESNHWNSIPLYILVSSYTCSAAEEFAYDLQSLHRAVIVGESTQGAAHPMERVDIGNGFSANIPFARPINPITKTDWEPFGVKPDRLTKSAGALDVAIRIILTYQISSTDSLTSKNARWLYFVYNAKHHQPYKSYCHNLKQLTGNYGGNKISLEKGNYLFYTSSTGYRVKLIPISKTTFLLDADSDNRELVFGINKKGYPIELRFNLDGDLSVIFSRS